MDEDSDQLIGVGSDFIYDFTSMQRYQANGIKAAYVTNNGDSRDYMLVQRAAGGIYSLEPSSDMAFSDVPGQSGDGHMRKLSKVGGRLFIIDVTD